jgi:hypothetical protein
MEYSLARISRMSLFVMVAFSRLPLGEASATGSVPRVSP